MGAKVLLSSSRMAVAIAIVQWQLRLKDLCYLSLQSISLSLSQGKKIIQEQPFSID
jgi:hypothetical protein